ncbi:MAG: hypothetical protein JW969_00395 [Spirochaetales bacterium]|nr:hypothetical protein [Spirochaetales bacterium]
MLKSSVDMELLPYIDPLETNHGQGIRFYALFTEPVEEIPYGDNWLYASAGDRGSVLTFEMVSGNKNFSTTYFCILPEGDDLRPGDDFVLDFKVSGEGNLTSFDNETEADKTPFFFAVVDDDLLKLARAYIDDSLPAFTWHNHDDDPSTNTVIKGAVAYSISAQDSPEEFRRKMSDQARFLEMHSQYIGCENPRDLRFTAPGNVWENYFNAINAKNLLSVSCAPLQDIKPYAPGFSNYLYYTHVQVLRDIRAGYDPWFWAGQSAGTDCVGFVQRCVNKSPVEYKLDYVTYSVPSPIGPHPWTWDDGTGPLGAARFYMYRRSLFYAGDGNNIPYLARITSRDDPAGLERIIPGDVFYYRFPAYHVALVNRVFYTQGTRTPALRDIELIESTWGTDENGDGYGSVIDFKSVKFYHDLERNWRLGRLIVRDE